VHGGGPQIAGMLKRLAAQERVRARPARHRQAHRRGGGDGAAGLINKDIVTAINRQGGKAVGISGKDANLMIARKITEMPTPNRT
jgi:acetylglutamate kinase